ncbi:hypothetical protein P3W85_26730 [Cupriavidus basilensis]|uniref:Lipoprotein transmembrane n=1 Tax=Cupriavidus basilensis TaxID=68895 RepID=A0ABT6AV72_9BURK|nr:hypothetical protein [Cupriavidus basilensis]MDF3836521.1 hypothetical protein [Cupriavidus basilensis]
MHLAPIRQRAWRAGGASVVLAAAVLLAACAGQTGASRHFDVDAFLRASDTALPEVLANPDFLAATKAPANDCAVLLQSVGSGVLQDLPPAGSGRGPAWLLHPAGSPGKVWLVLGKAGGERTCHGPLPADAMKTLADRAAGN